ncbi:hypothetical protein BH23ACT5_BH23ACT5_17690 [soil metagenome]
MSIICSLLSLYMLMVVLWVILSWVRVPSTHPLARVTVLLDRIIYPVILPLRRVMPAVRLGGGALDLSPVVLLIGLSLLRSVLCR